MLPVPDSQSLKQGSTWTLEVRLRPIKPVAVISEVFVAREGSKAMFTTGSC